MKTILKKTSFLIAGLSIATFAFATKHTVNVQNFTFSPSSFSASVGDTVVWNWIGGTHTTSSTSVPSGAATWDNPMSSTSTTFQYVITKAGTYNYQCNIHFAMGMVATFTVTATGVPVVQATKSFASIYPNPANKAINVNLSVDVRDGLLTMMDITGKEIIKQNLTQQNNSIDISSFAKGMYFYRVDNNGEMMEGKFEVQ